MIARGYERTTSTIRSHWKEVRPRTPQRHRVPVDTLNPISEKKRSIPLMQEDKMHLATCLLLAALSTLRTQEDKTRLATCLPSASPSRSPMLWGQQVVHRIATASPHHIPSLHRIPSLHHIPSLGNTVSMASTVLNLDLQSTSQTTTSQTTTSQPTTSQPTTSQVKTSHANGMSQCRTTRPSTTATQNGAALHPNTTRQNTRQAVVQGTTAGWQTSFHRATTPTTTSRRDTSSS